MKKTDRRAAALKGWETRRQRAAAAEAARVSRRIAALKGSVWAAMLAAPTLEEITEEDVQIATEAIRSAMERLR